jgi:hypothetical protein
MAAHVAKFLAAHAGQSCILCVPGQCGCCKLAYLSQTHWVDARIAGFGLHVCRLLLPSALFSLVLVAAIDRGAFALT